jgi:hypothetical protein
MFEFFKMGGPLAYPIALIGVTVMVLTVVAVIRLLVGTMPAGRAGELSLQALPFWGVVALLLGFLGQAAGHFKSLSAMAAAEMINPKAVIEGLRECFVTTLMGLTVCILALLAWGVLRTWHRFTSPPAAE